MAFAVSEGTRIYYDDQGKGDPLQALRTLRPPVPVLHVYGHPRAPEHLSTQESFARDHPWFAVRWLEAVSHFPTLEVPDETAGVIQAFIP